MNVNGQSGICQSVSLSSTELQMTPYTELYL